MTKPRDLPEDLASWFRGFSASAAHDMGRAGGGHKAELVAEQCIIALSCGHPELQKKFEKLTENMKPAAVTRLVAQHVRTL